MTDTQKQLDPLEDALLELNAAERARLFGRTRIDARQLLGRHTTGESSRSRRAVIRLLPVAAAIALAFGVWGWMFRAELADLENRKRGPNGYMTMAPAPRPGAFQRCFTGPTDTVPTSCHQHDFDADGDVDLADFRAYQLAYAEVTR